MKKTILVTGGAGFIGSNFVHHVVAEGLAKVVNLDKLTYAGNRSNLASLDGNPDHELIEGDIGDGKLVADLLKKHAPVAILNFAAESHVDRSIEGPEDFIQTNIVGSFELLRKTLAYFRELGEAEQDAFRFLHVSTDEVYGSLEEGDPAFSETTAYQPNSPYSASKAASDHLVRAYHHTYGLPTLTTNCSNNYGPYQFPEKLIPLVLLRALAGKSLPIYGDGLNIRDWLHVGDHCAGIWRVLERGRVGETYNIGGDQEKTNLEVVRALCQVLDELKPAPDGKPRADLIEFVADRPGHDRRYAIDAGKIKSELDWSPSHTFESGIRETVAWYLEHLDWCADLARRNGHLERLGLQA